MMTTEFIETPTKKTKKIKVRYIEQEKTKMFLFKKPSPAKLAYKQTKALHRKAIKQARHDIRQHKLLVKQAKTVYQLSK